LFKTSKLQSFESKSQPGMMALVNYLVV